MKNNVKENTNNEFKTMKMKCEKKGRNNNNKKEKKKKS